MDRVDKKDLQAYGFIRDSIVRTGVTPSLREIGRIVGYGSPRSAQLLLERLVKKGLIKRTNGVIHLSRRKAHKESEKTIEVPLVGSVPCGSPNLAEQDPEALVEVSTKIARPGHLYFFLRAKGTSMNQAGINPGDLVLVRQQSTAERGDRVVALINDEATIKRFHREGNAVVLKPDSNDTSHRSIVVSEEFSIQGVVVASLPESLL